MISSAVTSTCFLDSGIFFLFINFALLPGNFYFPFCLWNINDVAKSDQLL